MAHPREGRDRVGSGLRGSEESAKKRLQRPNGFVPVEDATKEALKEFRDAKKITKEEASSAGIRRIKAVLR